MNRVRIGLLLASAALAGVPSLAFAQDQGQDRPRAEGERGRGGERGDRAERPQGDPRGNRPTPAPQAAPAPAPSAAPQGAAGYAERRMQDAGRHYQTPGQAAPQQQQPAQTFDRGQAYQNANNNDRRGFGGDRGGNGANGWRGNDGRGADQQRPGGDNRVYGQGRPGYDGRGYDQGRPGGDNRGYNQGRPGNDGRGYGDRGYGDRRYDGGRGGPGQRFDRQAWRQDRRYDWRGYRDTHRTLFRAPRYVAPRGYGYGYRPFEIGFQLEPFFYDRSYWIDNAWDYRLPPVEWPLQWVRYYNDVLLVDVTTGQVVDEIRDFFW